MGHLKGFLEYLEEQVKNGSIYVWGGQGQDHGVISESWIRSMETSEANAERAIALWKKRVAEGKGEVLRAFDCSGLIMYYLQNLAGVIGYDTTANGLKGLSEKIGKSQLLPGDFVFRCYSSGKAYHVGVVVDEQKNVIEAKGRDDGVIKRPLDAQADYWTYYGRLRALKAEIEGGTPAPAPTPEPAPTGWELSRLLKRVSPILKGEDVRNAQKCLIAKGYSCGHLGADGQYGDDTKNAVIRFQQASGLSADGIVGEKTCAALGGVWRQSWTLSRLLKKVSPIPKGEDVRHVQEALISRGYSCGHLGADGQYGSDTKQAVKNFQQANGLTVDGIVGKNTCTALGGVWQG